MSRDATEGPTEPTATPLVDPDAGLPIGLRVRGRYRIVGELGSGAFGTVCSAEDEATGHPVAVRLLPRGLAGSQHVAQTVQRLGRSIVEVSTAHRGLVHVREFGVTESPWPFVAMEVVEGRRLSELLSGGKPLDVGAALRLAIDLGGALETLHNMGVVHGAIRPRNVVVLEDGRVKLMDLELAGLRDTMEGLIAAAPPAEYLSPEQICRAPVTEKADIYAFGIVLYEMLCGVPPFQAETREVLLAKHLTETPAPMRRRRRAVPVSVESAVALALYKQPELRPLMQDILNRLWAEAHGPKTRWKPMAAILGGAALAASIAALAAWSLLAPRPSEPPAVAQPAPSQVEQVPVTAPPRPSAPAAEARTLPAIRPATPAVAPSSAARAAAPRARPPASPPPRVERREPPAGSADADAYDPNAIIDWLLNRSSARGQ